MTTDEHIETPECGFDRNASHSAGHYVCTCGYEPINAGARGSKERVGNVQPSHAAPAPHDLAAMAQRIAKLEAQLAEAKSIALDAQSESAAYQSMQERAQGDNATLQEQIFRLMHNQQLQEEDAERYRWFRSKSLWDADQFPWPKDFEYPEPCLWDDGEMLDAAIDAARKV